MANMDPQSRAARDTRAYCPPSHWLRRGDKGADVAAWQELLVELGFAPGPVDGVFGPRTEAATRLLQTFLRTAADGVVDRITYQRALARLPAATATEEPPALRRTLGERALAVAIGEIGRHGVAGAHGNPRIAEYLAGCDRDRSSRGSIDIPAWCHAFRGYCEHRAAQPGELVLPWRASVAEGWVDAARAGKARPRSYRPRVGDVAIFGRDGGDPRRGGAGYVAFVASLPDADGAFITVGADMAEAVTRTTRNLSDPSHVGWIQID